MVRLESGVDHERTTAAPVLVERERIDAVDVEGGIRPGERQPEEILERPGREVGVVHDHDERKRPQRMVGADRRTEPLDVGPPRGRGGERPDRLVPLHVEPWPRFDPRPRDGDDAGQADPRAAEAGGQARTGRKRDGQLPDRRAAGGDDELRAGVEARARVVERVDRGLGVEMAIAPPVGPGEQMSEERADIVGVEARRIAAGDDEQVLGERQLSLTEDRRGLREQFGRPVGPLPGQVALAADGEQERMDARGVDCMDARHAGKHGGDHGPGEFVHQPAEERVLLRRATDDRHRPDRPRPMPDLVHGEQWKRVPARVVAEVVAERALGLRPARIDRALDDEVGVGVDGGTARAADHRHPMAGEGAGEGELRQALGQRHDRRDRQRRGAADEDRHLERQAAGQRRRMMNADAAMELVMEPDLAVGQVVVAGQLHPVHAEVRPGRSRLIRVLGVDRRQRDERAAVAGPGHDLRQP